MSNVTENLLVKGARGNVGKQFVYRTEDGETHIVKMPRKKDRELNAVEKQIRKDFSSASRFGRSAASSPTLGTEYKKKGGGSAKKAFVIAFKDYMTAPEVNAINRLKYTGLPGSVITVDATDDFKVAEVLVSIFDTSGTLIEEGSAVQESITTDFWKYTATQNNGVLAGTKIKATAIDVPGNEASLEVTL